MTYAIVTTTPTSYDGKDGQTRPLSVDAKGQLRVTMGSSSGAAQGDALPAGRASAAASVPVVWSYEDNPTSTTGTITSVASAATTVPLLAANANRKGATIFNDSSAALYVACAATASTSAYTLQVAAGGFTNVQNRYTGPVSGIWASANGNARITEFT